MFDNAVRELERIVTTDDSAEGWFRLGRALARAHRHDDAGVAYARARMRGADCDRELDELAPSLDELRVLAVHDVPGLRDLAWSRDGETLYGTDGTLLEIDPRTGRSTDLTQGGFVCAVGVGERWIAYSRAVEGGDVELEMLDARTGATRSVARIDHTERLVVFGRSDAYVGVERADRALVYRRPLGAGGQGSRVFEATGALATIGSEVTASSAASAPR